MRASGILMPIFSLPSAYGIGTFGREAYRFADFLCEAGQSFWQILPLNPTNYGDSPYQSFSSFAGNPYFIDIEMLIESGLLRKAEADSYPFGNDLCEVDYGLLYENRLSLLRKAFARFKPNSDFANFCNENAVWLDEYALFMAIKSENGDRAWYEWDDPLKNREPDALEKAKKEYSDDIKFHQFLQYIFSSQWHKLKDYANSKGVRIIGDIPIYVAYDSADVWAGREMFLLDKNGSPTLVAGCPPDAFSEDGQLWGNPLYDWDKMKNDGFLWWKRRLAFAFKTYDTVRIDHFRGFEAFYAVPFGDTDAKKGSWKKGPDSTLFCKLKKEFGNDLPIIAEDLGFLTPAVKKLLKSTGFPGMKVLQFAFDSREESDYLPHNYDRNCVVYTGTHDNDTIIGWTKSAPTEDVEFARRYMHADGREGFNWTMMRTALMSVADTAILMMPDLLGLDSGGRINTPSVTGGNWRWRIDGSCINSWLAEILREYTKLYGRLPDTDKTDTK